MYADIEKALEIRLAELLGNVAEIDSELRSALPADWEEQATKLEDQDALEGIEKTKLHEIRQIRSASEADRGRKLWRLRAMRRAHRPETPKGAADRDQVHFLRGLIGSAASRGWPLSSAA